MHHTPQPGRSPYHGLLGYGQSHRGDLQPDSALYSRLLPPLLGTTIGYYPTQEVLADLVAVWLSTHPEPGPLVVLSVHTTTSLWSALSNPSAMPGREVDPRLSLWASRGYDPDTVLLRLHGFRSPMTEQLRLLPGLPAPPLLTHRYELAPALSYPRWRQPARILEF